MSRMYFVIFILLASGVYFSIHYYLYRYLAAGLMLSPMARSYLRISLLIAALLFIVSEILCRYSASLWLKPIYKFGTIWFGVMGIALTVFLIANIMWIFFRTPPARHWITLGAMAVILLVTVYTIYNAARLPRIKELTITSPKIPQELSGFTIVQLADLHLNYQKSERWLEQVVESVNSQNPDLIVITGDLADADIARTNRFYGALKQLKAKHGVYAITGNHDFYNGIDRFTRITNDLKIRALRNEHVTIAGAIELVGVDDDTGKGFGGTISNGADLDTALKTPVGIDLERFIILLAHQPTRIFDEAVRRGVDLQLSGHTHWGQIPPMDFLIKLRYKYAYGLYRKDSATLYTTSGTDIWGPPMRLFSRCEIVKIILTADSRRP